MTIETPRVRLALPEWAQVSEKRRAHLERVTALLERWAPHVAR